MVITVYPAEVEAGLESKIKSNASIAYVSAAEPASTSFTQHISANLDKINLTRATNDNQIDLFYLKTLLVSTGWNLNDDVFDREEVWAARHTPEDKPFNFEHNQTDIIGHITSNFAIDDKCEIIPDDITVDKLPTCFHIATAAVLYKCWEDENLHKRMSDIIEEIAKGEWFVSMEALFKGFDYAVISPEGKHRVIARNEESAFLTKHLRVYGGEGQYNDFKIGRLLRGIVYSGKGLVRKPANPDSIIFDGMKTFSNATLIRANEINFDSKTNSGYNQATKKNNQEINSMPNEVELIQKQIDELKDTLAAVIIERDELKVQLVELDQNKIQAKADKLQKEVQLH